MTPGMNEYSHTKSRTRNTLRSIEQADTAPAPLPGRYSEDLTESMEGAYKPSGPLSKGQEYEDDKR